MKNLFQCLDGKKFYSILTIRGTLTKKNSKYFPHPYNSIHTPIESPCRDMLFLNLFELKSAQKNPKISVKIRLFKGRFKKSCFGPKIGKK
jgi:hypothetical protein